MSDKKKAKALARELDRLRLENAILWAAITALLAYLMWAGRSA